MTEEVAAAKRCLHLLEGTTPYEFIESWYIA